MAELFFLQASDNAFDRPPSVPHRKIHEQKPEVYYIEEQITGNERSSPSASHADPTLYHLQRSSPESSHDQRTTPVSNQEAFHSRPETYHLETQPPSSSGSANYSPDVQPTVIMYVLSASEGLKNFDKSHSPSPSIRPSPDRQVFSFTPVDVPHSAFDLLPSKASESIQRSMSKYRFLGR